MSLPDLAVAVLVLGLTAYAVLGGADFGAGFWDLTAGGARRGADLRGMVKLAMGPVWEANHVWLVFVLVVFWTAFPPAFAAVMETLYVPIFLAGVGIVLRGSAFALRGEAATIAEARALGATFALSSVLVPFCLGAVIGAIASGRVPAPPQTGEPIESWLNPTSVFIGLLAVATGAYVSAVFLAGDSVRVGRPDLEDAFRARALGAAMTAGALALGGLVVIEADAPALYDGLTSGAALVMVVVSGAAGSVALAVVWLRHFEIARYVAGVAVGAMLVAWVLAQRPDFLPGELTISDAAAGRDTLVALLLSVGAGLLVLVPSLYLLFRLTLTGRLDADLHPITPGEPPESAR